MTCTHCGSMIGPTDPSCPSCGAAVVAVPPRMAPATPPGAPPSDAPGAPPSAWPAVAPSAPPVSPVAAENQWAVPAPGTEWGVPRGPNQLPMQPPAQAYGYMAPARTRDAGAGYSIAGIICGVVALGFCPLVLGGIGLFLSSKAKARGESLAGVARVVSLVGLIGGFIIGVLVYTQM
jgi:hypothetical protein